MLHQHIQISAFKNAQDTEPTTVSLRQFLNSTRHSQKILALRAEADKKRRNDIKKTLPAATISGTFARRAADHITHYNGLVCLDFDAADNPGKSPDDMKAILTQQEEVLYAAVSAGGQGTFCVVPTNNTDPAQHAGIVEILGTAFAHLGLTYDRACKDVCRLRFVSFDPQAYWNPEPSTFDARRLLGIRAEQEAARPPRPLIIRQSAPAANGNKPDRTRERVEALIGAVEQARHDLTHNYDDWIKLGFAIAAHFGMEGEDYYQRLSQFHEKYDQHETEKKYTDFVRNGRRIKIGTFFKILENNGFSL